MMANRLVRVAARGRLARHGHRSRRPPRLPAGAALPAVRAVPRGRARDAAARTCSIRASSSASPRSSAWRPTRERVTSRAARRIPYDVLDRRDGQPHPPRGRRRGSPAQGWKETAFDFYTLEGARALRDALDRFKGGRARRRTSSRCRSSAPSRRSSSCSSPTRTSRSAACATRSRSSMRRRSRARSPSRAASRAARRHARAARHRGDRRLQRRRGRRRQARHSSAYDGREIDYDLLVTIPLHGGSEVMTRSGMGDAGGWIPTDKHTLQSPTSPTSFALGDATDLPASKAGAVAHFQSEVLIRERARASSAGEQLLPRLRRARQLLHRDRLRQGHADRLQLRDRAAARAVPAPGVGPFTLLEESAVNHWGKLAFKWIYWNVLLAGKELPLDHRMLMAGKRS